MVCSCTNETGNVIGIVDLPFMASITTLWHEQSMQNVRSSIQIECHVPYAIKWHLQSNAQAKQKKKIAGLQKTEPEKRKEGIRWPKCPSFTYHTNREIVVNDIVRHGKVHFRLWF